MKIVEAKLHIQGSVSGKIIEKGIQIKDVKMSDLLATIEVGDFIKLRGLMPIRINMVHTIPVKDAWGNYTLSDVTFYCTLAGDDNDY